MVSIPSCSHHGGSGLIQPRYIVSHEFEDFRGVGASSTRAIYVDLAAKHLGHRLSGPRARLSSSSTTSRYVGYWLMVVRGGWADGRDEGYELPPVSGASRDDLLWVVCSLRPFSTPIKGQASAGKAVVSRGNQESRTCAPAVISATFESTNCFARKTTSPTRIK
jgi:hypothetical protein